MPNRNPISQWAITFSQSGGVGDKTTFHEVWPPCSWSVCCEEEHKIKGVHLHLLIILRHDITKVQLLKFARKAFPTERRVQNEDEEWVTVHDYDRIQMDPIKFVTKWEHYCRKEDPDVHVTGAWVDKKKKVKPVMVCDATYEAVANYIGNKIIAETRGRKELEAGKREVEYAQFAEGNIVYDVVMGKYVWCKEGRNCNTGQPRILGRPWDEMTGDKMS